MSGEICPNTGDMNNCKKKPRCKWGNCEGQSLPSSGDYCPDNYSFSEESCSCTPTDCGPVCSLRLRYKILYDTWTNFPEPCVPTQSSCSGSQGNGIIYTIPNVINGSGYEIFARENSAGSISACSGRRNESAYIRLTQCVNGLPEVRELPLSTGQICFINSSDGYTIREIELLEASFEDCIVNIESVGQTWYNTYDCLDCSGVRISQVLDTPFSNVTTTSLGDYANAYLDCSVLNNEGCETACLWTTPSGKTWRDAGWADVINCPLAGTPDSNQNFDCPDNFAQPCNALGRPDIRYYSSRGTLYEAPRLV